MTLKYSVRQKKKGNKLHSVQRSQTTSFCYFYSYPLLKWVVGILKKVHYFKKGKNNRQIALRQNFSVFKKYFVN